MHHLRHESRVHLTAICESTGDIATVDSSGANLRIWTINGVLILTQPSHLNPITSVAFSLSEREPIVATGHSGGLINLWRRVPAIADIGMYFSPFLLPELDRSLLAS